MALNIITPAKTSEDNEQLFAVVKHKVEQVNIALIAIPSEINLR